MLGVAEAERAGNLPGYRLYPFPLASLDSPSSLSLSVFYTQCTGESQETWVVRLHQLLVVIMQVVPL